MTGPEREKYAAEFLEKYGIEPTAPQLMSYAAWARQQEREARLHGGLDGWYRKTKGTRQGEHEAPAHGADTES